MVIFNSYVKLPEGIWYLETSISQAKRFGLKGCEALLPALWALTEKARHLESRAHLT
jgi:hypothetical protein